MGARQPTRGATPLSFNSGTSDGATLATDGGDGGTAQNDAGSSDAATGGDSGKAVNEDSGTTADNGTVEGGGCSCRTYGAHGDRDTRSDGALFAIAAAGFLVHRRRRRVSGTK